MCHKVYDSNIFRVKYAYFVKQPMKSLKLSGICAPIIDGSNFNSEWRCAEPSVGRTSILVADYVKQQWSFQISITSSSNRHGVMQSQASFPTSLGATRPCEEFNQHLPISNMYCWCVSNKATTIGLMFLLAFRKAESLVVSILSKFIVYATGSCLHLLYMLHLLWIVCGAQSFEVTSK